MGLRRIDRTFLSQIPFTVTFWLPPSLPPTTGRKLHFKFGGTVMKIGTEFYDPSGREIAASLIKMSALIKFYLFWAAGAGAQAVAVRNNEDLNGSSWEFPSGILSRHPQVSQEPPSLSHWVLVQNENISTLPGAFLLTDSCLITSLESWKEVRGCRVTHCQLRLISETITQRLLRNSRNSNHDSYLA